MHDRGSLLQKLVDRVEQFINHARNQSYYINERRREIHILNVNVNALSYPIEDIKVCTTTSS